MPQAVGFSPTTVFYSGSGGLFTVTGRGLASTDVVQLSSSATCAAAGAQMVVVARNGTAGSRQLVVTTNGSSPAATGGVYTVCIQYRGAGSFVAVSATTMRVGELAGGAGGDVWASQLVSPVSHLCGEWCSVAEHGGPAGDSSAEWAGGASDRHILDGRVG